MIKRVAKTARPSAETPAVSPDDWEGVLCSVHSVNERWSASQWLTWYRDRSKEGPFRNEQPTEDYFYYDFGGYANRLMTSYGQAHRFTNWYQEFTGWHVVIVQERSKEHVDWLVAPTGCAKSFGTKWSVWVERTERSAARSFPISTAWVMGPTPTRESPPPVYRWQAVTRSERTRFSLEDAREVAILIRYQTGAMAYLVPEVE